MSPRYYWISTIVVIILTGIIGSVTKRNSGKQLVIIFIQVILGISIFVGLIAALAKLFVALGIAEEGFAL